MLQAKMAAGALFLSLVACAGAKPAGEATAQKQQQPVKDKDGKAMAQKDPRIVCRMERPTGSNIPERVCHYVEPNNDEERQRAQDAIRSMEGRAGPTIGN
jgi:hypothetical protein